MTAIPLVAVISALAINSIFHRNKIILVILVILLILSPSYNIIFDALNRTNYRQLQKIDCVLSMTDNKDFVYDGDAQFNIF